MCVMMVDICEVKCVKMRVVVVHLMILCVCLYVCILVVKCIEVVNMLLCVFNFSMSTDGL